LSSLTPDLIRQTFARYNPEVRATAEDLIKRLPSGREEAKLKELEGVLSGGNPVRGREVFFSRKAVCSTCHTVENQGGRVGPDLSKIGSMRSPRDLLESIVFPSASFVRGFEPYNIKVKGEIHNGVIARETAEAIYLYGADRTEIRIPRASIEDMRRSGVSIMPQGLDALLSRDELSDLIAFLMSLTRPIHEKDGPAQRLHITPS
jgi:putative heme-binding domain-containing protein